ncbi:hypothetical protein YSY43_17530 [Paenibacillus sp. YSY-4.3]
MMVLMTVLVAILAFVVMAVALMQALAVVVAVLVMVAMVPALPPVAQDSPHNAHRIEPLHLVVSHMKNKICNPIRSVLPFETSICI